jgi:2-oxoglutarate dehydrogenase E2 component (dihydrolipoamide succinyltransferase)
MKTEIKVPAVGESVQEAVLAQWFKRDGDLVRKDEVLFLLETDKVTLEIAAEADGVLKILVPEGGTVAIGAVVGTLDSMEERTAMGTAVPSTPAAAPEAKSAPPALSVEQPAEPVQPQVLAPSVRRLVAGRNLDVSQIAGSGPGGRVTKGDVLLHLEKDGATVRETVVPETSPAPQPAIEQGTSAMPPEAGVFRRGHEVPVVEPTTEQGTRPADELLTRKPMTRIRQRIAQRLLEARHNTAMLTTFNEIDMSRVQAIRTQYKAVFREKYGVSLGIMSFFIQASIQALRQFPVVNAFIDGTDVVYHHYYHIGVAIGAERGLVVPVIRHADQLGFAALEQAIVDYVRKVKDNQLQLTDLEGGTFTISNGGVYGSLLSTPILNSPQSGILGLHKIEDRPVAVDGQVVIRPMMYVALSYDHRLIDGREAVSFLRRIKDGIENPERIMLEI